MPLRIDNPSIAKTARPRSNRRRSTSAAIAVFHDPDKPVIKIVVGF
jgi:hypothetical protein